MIFQRNFVIACFDSYVCLDIAEAEEELRHADADGVLADLAHVFKVEL